jgi:hypothetical protein
MPKIRRHNIPPALLNHLLHRIRSREISAEQLGLFADWLDAEPEVPNDSWFKRFPRMIVCGEGRAGENLSASKSHSHGHRAFLNLVTRLPRHNFSDGRSRVTYHFFMAGSSCPP